MDKRVKPHRIMSLVWIRGLKSFKFFPLPSGIQAETGCGYSESKLKLPGI